MQIQQISKKKFAPASTEQKEETKKAIAKLQKEGEKMRKGIFEFVDAQGGWLDFSLRLYPGEPISRYRINHGEIVEIPMDLVRHLNNVYKKVRVMNPSTDNGKGDTITKISRCRFTPMDVM